jgi:hypothetical protein
MVSLSLVKKVEKIVVETKVIRPSIKKVKMYSLPENNFD